MLKLLKQTCGHSYELKNRLYFEEHQAATKSGLFLFYNL